MTNKTSTMPALLLLFLFLHPTILRGGAEIMEVPGNFRTRLDAQIDLIDLKVNIKDAEKIANLWIEKVFGKVLLLGTDIYYAPDGTINAYACEFYSEDSHSSITAIASAWRDDVPVIMMWKGRPFNKEREFSPAIEKKVSDELGLRLSKPNKFYWIDIYDFWAEYPEVNPINNQPIIYNYFQNRFCSKEELDKLWTNRLGWLQLMKKACELDFTLPEDEQISSPEYLRLAQLNLGAKYIEAQWQEADYVLAFLKDKKAIHANALDLSPKYSFSKYISNVPNIYQGGPTGPTS
jgi:hypothetical protein